MQINELKMLGSWFRFWFQFEGGGGGVGCATFEGFREGEMREQRTQKRGEGGPRRLRGRDLVCFFFLCSM